MNASTEAAMGLVYIHHSHNEGGNIERTCGHGGRTGRDKMSRASCCVVVHTLDVPNNSIRVPG